MKQQHNHLFTVRNCSAVDQQPSWCVSIYSLVSTCSGFCMLLRNANAWVHYHPVFPLLYIGSVLACFLAISLPGFHTDGLWAPVQ